jgi:ataxia telangiectasia mutated family protein
MCVLLSCTPVLLVAQCLKHSNVYDMEVAFRLVALWFKHSGVREVNTTLLDVATKFSHKFLPLRYQIASRLSTSRDLFSTSVFALILDMAKHHPYHCMYTLISLCNLTLLREDAKVEAAYAPNVGKQTAAQDVIKQMKASSHALQVIVTNIENLAHALLETSNRKENRQERSFREPRLNAIPNLKHIPVPILTLPTLERGVLLDKQREEIITIDCFHPDIRFAESGITRPMILSLTGSDGKRYDMLLKPKDDLRQDAVMEQLFQCCTNFLQENAATRRRNLRIRTYNVIPLTPSVGLVEWVPNTRAMSEVLLTTHRIHHRTDWTRQQLVDHFKNTTIDAMQRFQDVCSRCHPCFHKWFFDTFADPFVWYTRRQAYIRSVASNSMVGFIAGIGDRHVGNILIDTKSAELVHIDLGVAFDQGRYLRTPEVIPFRLTRDLIDGMGTWIPFVLSHCP